MPTKIVIVGGVAGGASAAARARRLSEDSEIVLIERGPYISFANCGLPYHIGGTIPERDDLLVMTVGKMKARFNLDIRTRQEVTAIDRQNRTVTVRKVDTGDTYTESYDKLILSPGAEPIRPPIPGAEGEHVHTLRTIPDMDGIVADIQSRKASRAVIVGGGYIGLEVAENLHERGLEVTLVEMLNQVMAPLDPEMAETVHEVMRRHGVELLLNDQVTRIDDSDGALTVSTRGGKKIEADICIMGVGVRPESRLAREAGLELGARDTIKVNPQMQTSDPDVYAVGDAVEVVDFVTGLPTFVPLAGPANRQGRTAADHIFGRDAGYHGTQGTAICKIFDWSVAVTGANEKTLRTAGTPYLKNYTHNHQHAGYYPGAQFVTIKLLFAPDTGKVLGAQVVGPDGVDKRIDVLATAIRFGSTVYDLEHLELAYAPPYGAAKDPVNMAGFAAVNILRGDVKVTYPETVRANDHEATLVDVRTPGEFEQGHVPGAVNIPVDEIRARLDDVPRDKPVHVCCGTGLRSYVATRILNQHGIQAANVAGGYKSWCQGQAAGCQYEAKQR